MRYSRLGVPLAVTIGLIGLAACDSSTGLDGRQRMQKSQPLAFRVKTGPEPGLPTPDFDGARAWPEDRSVRAGVHGRKQGSTIRDPNAG